MIERVVDRLRCVTDDVIIISNTPEVYSFLELPVYTDVFQGVGALAGLHAALHYAKQEVVACVGCDMPLLEPALLSYLASLIPAHDAVVPQTVEAEAAQLQTLSAVYSKSCLPVIAEMVREGERRVHALYSRINARIVPPEAWQAIDPHGLSFFNVNTPQDFEKATTYFR